MNDNGGLDRRSFIRLVGLGAAATLLPEGAAMAGPFATAEFEKWVPADKKLRPEWVQSLFERGAPQVYRGAELEKIGMPVGGIGAGQLYLGGDGKLWHWDIFNLTAGTGDAHYAHPPQPSSPLDQGFALRLNFAGTTQVRALDRSGFQDIAFRGEYPIGRVEYRDPAAPVTVALEAFSPFIPLNTADSALPATILRYTVKNTGAARVEAELAGWLENAVCLRSEAGVRRNRVTRRDGLTLLECSAEAPPTGQGRPDIVFEDFEKETYEGWTASGTAFGPGPIAKTAIPAYQGDVGGVGRRVVNTHNARQGEDVGRADAHIGRLTSKPFIIERNFITFLIGGGNHPGQTCLNLVIDDKIVRTATGRDSNAMRADKFDVREFAGRTAHLEIVDEVTGAWGNIGLDHIVFSDSPAGALPPEQQPDFGTLALALLGVPEGVTAKDVLPAGKRPNAVFTEGAADADAARPCGALSRKMTLEAGQEATVTFVVAWHFPNLKMERLPGGRRYATRFDGAAAVADYVAKNFDALSTPTRLWRDTWYDSSLPFWLLDRTFANTSILATSTCFWFANGRFYGWEGVGCCPGTCDHVWHYAQAVGRLFPELERDTRERVDLGIAFNEANGVIGFRAEFDRSLAVDGQAGTLLRIYREHQMSPDDGFLKRNWPKIKKACEALLALDFDGDGIMEGAQMNTLDTAWHGKIAWLSSLYCAALRAVAQMARETGDTETFAVCTHVAERGANSIAEQLFNGEYFINVVDPKRADTINSGTGCEIDQVFGQSWAWQVGLGRVLPEKATRSALAALWRYNFTPDAGTYRAVYKAGRWYAMAGEAGLLMCSFPRQDWDYKQAAGKGPDWAAGYFNECMTGFEYQVAGHMLWEGLVQEGLAVTRAIHDRYHAARRNPWNEVECGDHYARAMASYGVFLAACGYEHHGPQGHLGFAPRLTPENFRAPFTTAEGWGTFAQTRQGATQRATVAVKWGQLALQTLAFELPPGKRLKSAVVTLAGRHLAASTQQDGTRVLLKLPERVTVRAGQSIEARLDWA